MAGLKHATKKRFSKASTRSSTITKGISAEYVAYRSKLDKLNSAVKTLVKHIKNTSKVWGGVAKHQNEYANVLLAAIPADGSVQAHAREVEGVVRQLQRLMLEGEGEEAPHKRMITVLEAYVRQIDAVQKDYSNVEMTFTEILRYQKKVDKLGKKGEKKADKLQQNVDKLTSARAEHETKLDDIMKRMKEVYEKHEAMFQCAHHAFWIAQEKYSSVINNTTRNIRMESMAVRNQLASLDIATGALPPLPRVKMIESPDDVAPDVPTVTIERVESAKEKPVTIIVPSSPPPQDDVSAAPTKAKVRIGGQVSVDRIPDVPTETPTSPLAKQEDEPKPVAA